jgi:hypothetical protein
VSIAGKLDMDAMRILHFTALDQVGQAEAIRRMAREGYSELAVSQATGLSIEQIRRTLLEVPA